MQLQITSEEKHIVMWSRLKVFAYVTGILGLAFPCGVGAISTLFLNDFVAEENRTGEARNNAKETQAARFANSVEGNSLDDSRRASNAVDHVQMQSMAKSVQMRGLTVSHKDQKRQLGVHTGPSTRGRREGRDDASNSGGVKSASRKKRGGNRNGNDQTQVVNLDDMQMSRQDGNKHRNRKSNNRRNENENRNGGHELSDVDRNSMNLNKRERNKDKNSNKLDPKGRNNDESIAETWARTQLKLRPELELKKRTHSFRVNKFPFRYPKIRYVPWDQLSKDTKEIVDIFGYKAGSWDDMSHIAESRAFSELSTVQQKSALLLGIDKNVWDCFVNHYRAYGEQDLEILGLGEHAKVLSNVQSKWWDQLSKDEIQSATMLCYFEEVWNREALGTW